MPRRALTERLEELHERLAASTTLSEEERRRLEALLSEARLHAAGEDAEDEPASLVERLQEATSEFEEAHPKLTQAIGAVAEALSRLGI